MIASLSATPATVETPAWQSTAIVAHSKTAGDIRIDASADAAGHVRSLSVAGIAVPPTWIGTLPPLELDTLSLKTTSGVLSVAFATGGEDDEHVRFAIDHGKITSATIAKVSAEGKERTEVRTSP
jgi:hypothetical protein